MLNSKLIDEEYPFLKGHVFLNVSSVVMPPKRVQEAYQSFMPSYVANFANGFLQNAWSIAEDTRVKFAKLVNAASPAEIAFVKNTCEGISIIADGYPFKKGENIVIADQEHSANLFPWINLHQRKGVELHVVESRNGEILIEDMANAIDGNTRAVAISAVQFTTGFYADLYKLGQICKERGVLLIVDGIQALGRLKIDVQEMNIDWLASATNKGLLGTLSLGIVYCRSGLVEKVIPPYASYQSVVNHVAPPAITTNFNSLEWHSDARRFESGNLNYNEINAVNKGLELILELGIENIEEHVKRLEQYLRSRIADLTLRVVQAKDPKNWGGIVCVYYPAQSEEAVIDILKKHNIICTMRGGYIRLGLDFYNTFEQMDAVSEALHEIENIR